jgi:hypothetical protein
MDRLQDLRIELLEKMLRDNEARQYDTSIERINRQWSQRQVEREEFIKTNRLHYLRGEIVAYTNRRIFSISVDFVCVVFFKLSEHCFISVRKWKQNISRPILFVITANLNRLLMVH